MRGRLFGDGAFSFGPGDCGRWPFISMLEPSRCICAAAIIAGVILLPILPMGPFPLLPHVSLHSTGAGDCVERIRSIVHGGGALEVVGGAVDHAAVPHHALVLRVHGVVHHHAVVPLIVLQLGEVLSRLSVPVASVRPRRGQARPILPVCV
jgi:hypothetical protein